MSKLTLPRYFTLATAFAVILLSLGCGDEPLDNTGTTSLGEESSADVPSTIYFPMSIGNRWVYRNPDGSEWSREVAESHSYVTESHHSFNYNPPIELDSIGPAEYITYADRIVREIKITDFNDSIWQTILDTSSGPPQWGLGLQCDLRNPAVCLINKPSGILSMLFKAHPHIASRSELTSLRFPLFPNQTYTALELKLNSKYHALGYFHDFRADAVIVAAIGSDLELVETPAGRFQDCLKIQYDAGPISFKTVQFVNVVVPDMRIKPAALKAFELTIHDELTDLLALSMPKLGLQTMWLSPGVGPVKIEMTDGIAELIYYDIKPAQ